MSSIRKITKNIGTVAVWGEAEFDENVHENYTSLKEIVPQVNNSIDDINLAVDKIDITSKEIETNAQKVAISELNAQGSANFKGNWVASRVENGVTLNGYTQGQSVYINNSFYVCSVTHTTAKNPTTATGYWIVNVPLGAVGNINSPLLDLPLKNSLAMKAGVGGSATLIRATTAKYHDIYGVLKTAAINEARFQKNGFLNEGTSTNLVLWSQDASNAIWLKQNGLTITTNTTTQADSITLATKIIPSTTAARQQIRQSVVITPLTNYTFSRYFKASEYRYVTLLVGSQSITPAYGSLLGKYVDLVDGKVYTRGTNAEYISDDIEVELLANGWVKVSMTFNSNTVNTSVPFETFVFSSMAVDENNISGDGVSGCYIGAAQVEALPYATSYIPTTTSAVTRAADILSVPAANNVGLGSSEKTYIIDVVPKGFISGVYQNLINLGGVSYNLLRAYDQTIHNSLSFFFDANGQYANYELLANTKYRLAVTISGGTTSNISTYINGVLKTTGSRTIVTEGIPTSIQIGHSINVSQAFGEISNFRVYNKVLTEQEIALA